MKLTEEKDIEILRLIRFNNKNRAKSTGSPTPFVGSKVFDKFNIIKTNFTKIGALILHPFYLLITPS